MIKLLLGGSPCTHWSIAQKNGRETQPNSGLGWELFLNYKIALEKYKPDYFLYENNRSASQAIKDEICNQLGYPLQYINSALVSAQSRERFYVRNWECPQPEDRKIYLDDILTADDFYPYNGGEFIRMKDDLSEHYDGCWQIGCTGKSNGQAVRVYDLKGKSVTIKSQAGGGGGKTGLYLFNGKVFSLDVSGVEKLQTVPAGYTACVPKETAISLLGNGWTVEIIKHLADLNEQAQNRLEFIIEQMRAAEGVTESLKQHDQMAWVGAMNSIRNRAEEIILREMIYEEDAV